MLLLTSENPLKFTVKVRSHGAAAATVPLSIGFQPHSVWQ